MANVYDIGDQPRATVTFTDLDGTTTDPSTVTCTVRKPDGTITEPVAASAEPDGTWYADIPVDQAGTWRIRFEGTGALIAAVESRFQVRDREVPEPT